MRKINIYLLLLAIFSIAISTNGQNYILTTVAQKNASYFSIDNSLLKQGFDKDGGIKYVDVTSNLLFTTTSDQLWCVAEPVTQNGKRIIQITAAANSSASSRTATISVKAKDNFTTSISVIQIGTSPSLTVTEDQIKLYDDTYDFSLEVLTNNSVSFETPSWLTSIDVTPVVGLKRYKFQASEYLDKTTPRTGNIVIKTAGGILADVTIPITQTFRGYPRFAVISDLHFGNSQGIGPVAKNTMIFRSLATKNLDAVFALGDLTDWGTEAQWQQYKSVMSDPTIIPSTMPVYVMMGNHDHYNSPGTVCENLYKTYTGQPLHQYIDIKGYPFITISMNGTGWGNYSAESVQFLKASLENAAVKYAGKPIFVLTHVPTTGTTYGSNANDGNFGNTVYDNLLKAYPQVILMTGHTHAPLGDPRSIYQNFYTSVNDGSSSYSVIESGTVNIGSSPENSANVTEGIIVTIDRDKNVTLERRDTYRDEEIVPAWHVNAPHNGTAFLYKNRTNAIAAVFAANSVPTVSEVTQTTCKVTFPQATETADDVVHHYVIEILDGTTVVSSFKKFSEFYLNSAKPTQFTVTLGGLPEGKTLKAQVKAVDAYFNRSTPIVSSDFTTESFTPTPGSSKPAASSLLLDVKFNVNGTATDASAQNSTITTGATTPVTYLNSTYNIQTAKFTKSSSCFYKVDYQNKQTLKDAFVNGFTFETVYKANTVGSLMHPFSALEAGGMGIMHSFTSANLFQFRVRFGSSYADLYSTIPIVANKYYHILVSYDKTASKLRMYIDGVLAGELATTGTLSLPVAAAQWIGIGGDAGTGTVVQNPLDGEIVIARIYNKAITRDEAYWLYQEVKK